MKRLVFAIVGTAALTLAACNSNNQDSVKNAENEPAAQPKSSMTLANQAANGCGQCEAQRSATQEQQLQQENAALDNAVNPQEADEQNVSGM